MPHPRPSLTRAGPTAETDAPRLLPEPRGGASSLFCATGSPRTRSLGAAPTTLTLIAVP